MTFNFLRGPTSGHLDVSRMLWALSVLAGIGYSGAHLVINHSFSIIEFGTGMGLLLAGGGTATALKDRAVAQAVAQGTGEAP
ncbi:hypothetical protein QH494_15910 [Sphingomonas sp. AR_OL41]|uniref:hypothetical protein n=1 Tax=Sphingomonas sp. AR_OL41 TaxID=3042729 RepID=UPI0024805CF9|nr:hypothetical protein [Sphingomonas sp. AR_OL41]MDH7973677.1 hypothetical protein [Sphingomonas sp. AR_OL41]